MTRRLILLFALLLAAFAGPARAEDWVRPYKVYMILWRGETAVERGFRAQMQARGVPVEYVVRDARQNVDRIPGFIEEARRLGADLVYTWGTPATVAAAGAQDVVDPSRHLTDIPLVFTMVASPRSAGLAHKDGLSHRNLTGTSHVVPADLQIRAIQAYRRFERLAVIYNPAEPNSITTLEALRAQASRQGFTLIEQPVPLDESGRPLADELPRLVARVTAHEPQFLYLPPDSFIGGANAKVLTREAVRHRLPTFSATEAPLRDADALFGLVARYDAVGRLTARKAEEVLKGRNPAEIPIETLARFSLVVRMGVARQLDFYPPVAMLGYAEVLP